MKRIRRKLFRLSAIAAVLFGTTFQIGSCTIDENGMLNITADLIGLSELQGQLLESGGFGLPFGRGFGRGFGHHGHFGAMFMGDFEELMAAADEVPDDDGE